MIKIRDSELASVLGDEQLRSLGFVPDARGRWLRKHTPSPMRYGSLRSPRRTGVTKRLVTPPRSRNGSGASSVRSRVSSASGSRADSSGSRRAAAPVQLLANRKHVSPFPVHTVTDGFGWPHSYQTPTPSFSPITGPQSLPRVDEQSQAHLLAPPWCHVSRPDVFRETASGVENGSDGGNGQMPERQALNVMPALTTSRRGQGPSVASASPPSSPVSSVVSRLSYDYQQTPHEVWPQVFPHPDALSHYRTQNLEPLAHLPAEIRLEIVNELGPSDILSLRRAFPVAFGFIYDEDARYQRLYKLERLTAIEAKIHLIAAKRSGSASAESQASDRERVAQLERSIRPKREPLLWYAVQRGYPMDDIKELVDAYRAHGIDLSLHAYLRLGKESLLFVAIDHGREDVVKYLLHIGVEDTIPGVLDCTAHAGLMELPGSDSSRHLESMVHVLADGGFVDLRAAAVVSGRPADWLVHAVRASWTSVVQRALEGLEGEVPSYLMHTAIRYQDRSIMNLLVNHGADAAGY